MILPQEETYKSSRRSSARMRRLQQELEEKAINTNGYLRMFRGESATRQARVHPDGSTCKVGFMRNESLTKA